VKIKSLDPLVASQFLSPKDERWLAFIASKPESTNFHHPSWLNVLAETYGYHPFVITVCDAAGKIVAGLPVLEIRSRFRGRRWVSLPFTDYCEPLYDDPESLHQLTNDLIVLYQVGAAPRIEVRWELPSQPEIQSQTAYNLHRVRLNPDSQIVLKGFKRTHRQNIDTAEERGVHIEWGTATKHLRDFYQLQLETRRRKGVPVQPWRFFDLLGKHIISQGLGFLLLAYKDAQLLAGGLFLHWQQTLTYKYAASSGEEQQYRPNNLLSWEAMCWGCENGYTIFDLGRSELANEGLCRFKRGWGAEETPLSYSVLSTKPPDTGNGKLVSWMGRVVQKSPPWVCRFAGELLYRHFG
jgi:hypothetical protein